MWIGVVEGLSAGGRGWVGGGGREGPRGSSSRRRGLRRLGRAWSGHGGEGKVDSRRPFQSWRKQVSLQKTKALDRNIEAVRDAGIWNIPFLPSLKFCGEMDRGSRRKATRPKIADRFQRDLSRKPSPRHRTQCPSYDMMVAKVPCML